MLPQDAIDFGLISGTAWRISLEPGQHVGVQAQCDLFFDRAIEETALDVRRIHDFGDVALFIELILIQVPQELIRFRENPSIVADALRAPRSL